MTTEALAYVNGDYVPRAAACVPLTDRGLLFGDSVYEVIPAYGGRPFRVDHHLDRLDRSLAAIRLHNPLDRAAWQAMFARLTAQFPGADQSIYLQVTRGAYPVRNHVIPEAVAPAVYAFSDLMPQRRPEAAARGIAVITLDDIRWHRCDIKATTLLANVLARAQATAEGADEAILVRDGQVMEGSASNLFIVSNGLLITPPDSPELLPGITRDLVLELARDSGIAYAQAAISMAELENADEIWLTSSTREVSAVVTLDGRPVGDGTPGVLWQRMDALYQACKQRLREGGECQDD
ncbi:MAG: D-amino acid aminotransferase [Gammaproteobacteria bacterium]|nr:D-amino acid aminotransferase [Gammaproteobacteria bacterium]